MKILHSKTAFTLIELIIASLLVVVVLLGTFSITNVLSNSGQDYGQRYLVKSETQASLNHVLNNASLAQGSANNNDEGILYNGNDPGIFDANSFCIHQPGNLVGGVNTPNSNAINFLNDIWLCYTLAAGQINWCAEKYTPGADPRGASSCTAAPLANIITASTYLGTALNFTPTFTNAAGGQLLFSIVINNCLDTTLATCTPAGDPVNNPYISVTGSVIPTQESN
jgi:hypothetical protein